MPEWRWPAPYTDHLELIPDEELLYRRISRAWLKEVDSEGVPILDSQAFQDLRLNDANDKGYELRCMSVGIGHILNDHGGPPAILGGHPATNYGVAELRVACIRESGQQGIMAAPEDGEPWHAVVFAVGRERRSKAMEKAAARCATWWQLPSETDPDDFT